MAIITGAWTTWVPAPGNDMYKRRMRLVATVDVAEAMPAASKVKVKGKIVLELAGSPSLVDPANVFTTSGSLLGKTSKSVPLNVPAQKTQILMTFDKDVTMGPLPTGMTIGAALAGVETMGVSPAVLTGTITIPGALPASAARPAAPTGLTVSRRSDREYVIGYTASATVQAPIVSVKFFRQDYLTGVTTQIGSAKWGAGTGTASGGITDKGTVAQNRYRWGVATVNSYGQSATTWTGWFKTTPTGPQGAWLGRNGQNVTGSWQKPFVPEMLPDPSTLWDRLEFRAQYGSSAAAWGAWENLGSQILSKTWTPTQPVVRFQVRSVVTEGGTTLYGPPSTSAWILALAKPNKPKMTGPVKAQAVGSVPITWIHNPVDGSGQLGYELRWRVDAGGWTVLTGTTALSRSVTLPAGAIEVQVRTKGEHSDFSDWSDTLAFVVAELPTFTITSPPSGGLTDVNRLTMTFEYGDAAGAPMASYEVQLTQAGVVIETYTLKGLILVDQLDTILKNGVTYTARARATSGYGLTSTWSQIVVNAVFSTPRRPAITQSMWDEDQGVVTLTLSPGEEYTQLLPNVQGEDTLATALLNEPNPIIMYPPGGAISAPGFAGPFVYDTPVRLRLAQQVRVEAGQQFRARTFVTLGGDARFRWSMVSGEEYGTEERVTTSPTHYAGGWSEFLWTASAGDEIVTVYLEVWGYLNEGQFFSAELTSLYYLNFGADADRIRLERSLDDGSTWHPIANDLPTSSAFIDWTVPQNLDPPAKYRPVGLSVVGVEAIGSTVTVETPSLLVWLNSDDGLAVPLRLELGIPTTFDQDVVFEHYFGDKAETAYFGTLDAASVQLEGAIVDRPHEKQLRAMQRRTFWYRDPVCRSFRAAFDQGLTINWRTDEVASVSVSVKEVNDGD